MSEKSANPIKPRITDITTYTIIDSIAITNAVPHPHS